MFFSKEPESTLKPWVLSQNGEEENVSIAENVAKDLSNYQILGIDFLYQKFIKKFDGAILNEEDGMNMPIQVCAFLHAVCKEHKYQLLVICEDHLVDIWHYHLEVHGGLNVEVLSIGSSVENDSDVALILAFSNLKMIEKLSKYTFDVTVIDDYEKVASKMLIRKIKADFRIGLTQRSFMTEPDQKLQWTMLNWSNPSCVGKLKEFYNDDDQNFYNLRDNYKDFWFRLTWKYDDSFKKLTGAEEMAYRLKISNWQASPKEKVPNERKTTEGIPLKETLSIKSVTKIDKTDPSNNFPIIKMGIEFDSSSDEGSPKHKTEPKIKRIPENSLESENPVKKQKTVNTIYENVASTSKDYVSASTSSLQSRIKIERDDNDKETKDPEKRTTRKKTLMSKNKMQNREASANKRKTNDSSSDESDYPEVVKKRKSRNTSMDENVASTSKTNKDDHLMPNQNPSTESSKNPLESIFSKYKASPNKKETSPKKGKNLVSSPRRNNLEFSNDSWENIFSRHKVSPNIDLTSLTKNIGKNLPRSGVESSKNSLENILSKYKLSSNKDAMSNQTKDKKGKNISPSKLNLSSGPKINNLEFSNNSWENIFSKHKLSSNKDIDLSCLTKDQKLSSSIVNLLSSQRSSNEKVRSWLSKEKATSKEILNTTQTVKVRPEDFLAHRYVNDHDKSVQQKETSFEETNQSINSEEILTNKLVNDESSADTIINEDVVTPLFKSQTEPKYVENMQGHSSKDCKNGLNRKAELIYKRNDDSDDDFSRSVESKTKDVENIRNKENPECSKINEASDDLGKINDHSDDGEDFLRSFFSGRSQKNEEVHHKNVDLLLESETCESQNNENSESQISPKKNVAGNTTNQPKNNDINVEEDDDDDVQRLLMEADLLLKDI